MKDIMSYSTAYIKHQRNILVLMTIVPVVVMGLVAGVFYAANQNATTQAQVVCTQTISSGSVSSAVNALSSGQTLCLTGTFNQSVSITKAGVGLASTPGQTARIIGQLKINQGANNVRVMNLYLNGNGIIVSPHILANNAYFYGNQVTNDSSSSRGICFAIGETDIGVEVQGITIDSNRIFRCGDEYHDQGIYAEYVRNAQIRNNYIYDNPDFAIQFYPSAQDSVFEYNVVDGNARGITYSSEARNINKASNRNIVRNNIITNSPDAYNLNYYWGGPTGTGNVAQNNCLFGGGKGNIQPGLTNYIQVTGTVTADPMYVNRAAKDFRLKPGSPCAGKGPQTSTPIPPTPTPPPPTPTPPPPTPPTPAPNPPSPSPTPNPSPTPIGPSSNFFGKNTVGSAWTSMSPNAKRGSKFVYSGSTGQQLYQVGGFLRGASGVSGSQTVNVAVYSDNGGQPATLLSKGVANRSISAGQAAARTDFTLDSPINLTPGASYWLMYYSGQQAGVAEYSHVVENGALRWQGDGGDLFSDGPSQSAGSMNTDNKSAVIWGLYRSVAVSPPPTTNPPQQPPPPPITIPGSNPTTPVIVPSNLPKNPDGSLTGDFNGDGLNDIARDANNDGRIDPNNEIITNGTSDPSLTDQRSNPISVDEYASLKSLTTNLEQEQQNTDNSNTVTFKAGPLPEVTIAKPVAYTFLIAQGVIITGLGSYLAITKLAIFAGIRGKLGW